MSDRKSNPFYTLSPKVNQVASIRPRMRLENSISNSSADSERKPKTSSPNSLFFSSAERELDKVYPGIKIRSQKDVSDYIKKITADVLNGNFLCSSCKDRIDEIEYLTSEIHNQKISAIDEIEKIRELKGQVKKYEILLKNKEKSLDLQQISITESREQVDKKIKWLENSLLTLETEKNKLKDERKRLEDEKFQLNKKFKKLDEQFFVANKEVTQDDPQERPEMTDQVEKLTKLSAELQKKQEIVLEITEKFGEMKGKIEESHKNLENLIKEKILSKDSQETITRNKLKKLKKYVKSLENKLLEIVDKKEEANYIKPEEAAERLSAKSMTSEKDLEDKDSLIHFYKARCEILEESLRQKDRELEEFNIYTSDLLSQLRHIESKEKELQEFQNSLALEKRDIIHSAETLKEVYLQLESQQHNLIRDKEELENERKVYKKINNSKDMQAISEEDQFCTISPPEMAYQASTEDFKETESPVYGRQSLHFGDDDLLIRLLKKPS